VHLWLCASVGILCVVCVLIGFSKNNYTSKPFLGFDVALVIVLSCIGGLAVQIGGAGYINVLVYPVLFIVASKSESYININQ
jgi:hypothetical protein